MNPTLPALLQGNSLYVSPNIPLYDPTPLGNVPCIPCVGLLTIATVLMFIASAFAWLARKEAQKRADAEQELAHRKLLESDRLAGILELQRR